MKMKLAAGICIVSLCATSTALAYDRSTNGYSSAQAETQDGASSTNFEGKSVEEIEKEIYSQERSGGGGGGPGGTMIGGYVLLALGGVTAIAGSAILAATDHRVLGISLASGGAAMSLAGTLMITLGSHSGYSMGPSVDPKHGTYGVVLAKKF
jgi:hypothetical protein